MSEQTPWAAWQHRIAAAKKRRDDRVSEWQENVDLRKGSISKTRDAADRIAIRESRGISVNQDWPLTKAKIAQLYSQTPEVRLTPRDERFAEAVQVFGRELNDVVGQAAIGATIEECLADVINASGIAGVLVSCEIKTEKRQVPEVDPATLSPQEQALLMQGAIEIPMVEVDAPTDVRYLAQRISPADLLIPDDFTGSTYDQARWLGEEGRMTWAQAVSNLGLTDDVKEKVLQTDRRASGTTHSLNSDSLAFKDTDVVNYTQVFYWRHYYHPEETSFSALQRVVFVDGLEEPVINEPYRAQARLEDGRLIGVVKNPIRILTLTYISDDALPPSDSSVGRFQVEELEASRDAMVQQRKHSTPIRWFDTNRVGPNTRNQLEKGDFQGFIGINGAGERAIGEVARASYPAERFEFDRVIKGDLTEIWQVGTNQAGAFAAGERSAREAGIIERNFQRRVGQEQDKVSRFFLGIVEVLAGHLALYGRFPLPDALGPLRQELGNAFTYNTRVDATVRLEADEQIERLTKGLNLTAQSGHVNIKPVVAKIWELLGEDPAQVVIDPQPKPPEPVKLSISSALDLHDPVVMATLMRTQQAPTPEDVQAAQKLMQALELLGVNLTLPTPEPVPGQPSDPQTPGIANPNWDSAPRIERRQADGGA